MLPGLGVVELFFPSERVAYQLSSLMYSCLVVLYLLDYVSACKYLGKSPWGLVMVSLS